MKIFLSEKTAEDIRGADRGTRILGTFSREHGVATVTGIAGPGAPGDEDRACLAAVGEEGPYPLSVKSGARGVLEWTNPYGRPVEVITYRPEDFFRRTPFKPEVTKHLGRERLLIVGTGSVGAPMGLELARSGVGTIIPVDKDTLEIHNCMRHVLGAAYIGWPKPQAFARYLEEHSPACKCLPVFADLFSGDRAGLRRLVEESKPTRILAATDSLRVQYLCQRLAIHYGIPLMAVWCDDNAVEGEIFLWETGEASGWKPGRQRRGCYACMRDPESASIKPRSRSFDYTTDDPDSYGGEPALGTFINRVNNIASIVMTAWMLRDCPVRTKLSGILDEYYEGYGLQYIRLGGPYPMEPGPTFTARKPWGVEWYRVSRREACDFCRDPAMNERQLFPPAETPISADFEDFEKTS